MYVCTLANVLPLPSFSKKHLTLHFATHLLNLGTVTNAEQFTQTGE
jgi:hypothetical protein